MLWKSVLLMARLADDVKRVETNWSVQGALSPELADPKYCWFTEESRVVLEQVMLRAGYSYMQSQRHHAGWIFRIILLQFGVTESLAEFLNELQGFLQLSLLDKVLTAITYAKQPPRSALGQLRYRKPPVAPERGTAVRTTTTLHAGDGLVARIDIAKSAVIFAESTFDMVDSAEMPSEVKGLVESSGTETAIETSLENGRFRLAVYQPRFLRSTKPEWFMLNHATDNNVRADWCARCRNMVFTATRTIRTGEALTLFYGEVADDLYS